MRRETGLSGLKIVVTPVVALVIFAALWIALSAARENVRFARATDQVLTVLAIAREAPVDPSVESARATGGLYERLSRLDAMRVIPPDPPYEAFAVNPWGGRVTLDLMPAQKRISLATWVSPSACRRHIRFFAKDAAMLGLQFIEVFEEDLPGLSGRTLYPQTREGRTAVLDARAIRVACGAGEWVVLKLIFALR